MYCGPRQQKSCCRKSLMHVRCIHVDVVRVGSGPLLADAHAQYARRRERNTKQAETAPPAANPSTQHTQPARVITKIELSSYENRVSSFARRVVGDRLKKSGGEGLAGWLAGWLASLLGAMEAGRRIRRVRFCMHFCMPIDSVMMHNFTAPGSHLELRRA